MCNKKMVIKCKHEFEYTIILDDCKKIDDFVLIKGSSFLLSKCNKCGYEIKELCTTGFFERGE